MAMVAMPSPVEKDERVVKDFLKQCVRNAKKLDSDTGLKIPYDILIALFELAKEFPVEYETIKACIK